MNPRGNERHLCNLQIMKLASHEKLLRWHITIWCTSLFQCDKPWRILDAKAAVDKEWTKLKTIPAWQLDRAKSKKEVIDEARRDKNNVHFATLMDVCHLEKWGVSTRITEVQRQSRALGDIVKYGPGAYAFFFGTGLVCVPDDCCKKNGR